jgi:hypothetical protein
MDVYILNTSNKFEYVYTIYIKYIQRYTFVNAMTVQINTHSSFNIRAPVYRDVYKNVYECIHFYTN